MEERREEDFDQEFNDEELDLTEDAFFSDLTDMEEEIATEAYELVEHAINLIDSQYYDDSVEILRQAIGLYTQINRTEEIKAINDKISEVYMLKEKAFRETEEISEKVVEVKDKSDLIEGVQIIKEIEASEEDEVIKGSVLIEEANLEDNLINNANELIVQAHELSNINMFEEALDKYDEAEKILQELGKFNEIERLYSLIEECYDKKAEYLRSFKKEEAKGIIELDATLRKELEKEKKLQQFLDAKKHEEKVSSNAYELLDQAVELAKMHEYDKAIKLYTESANLFEELNWSYEAKRIRETIEQLKQEKVKYIKELEKERAKIEQKIETEIYKEKLADQHFKEISEHERIAKMERMRGIEIQKMEQEFLKVQIDNMATEASRMAREYELAMKKAIKKGSIVEECIYPEVIEIYKKIKELLIDKGWNTEAAIYDDTINVYIQKHEQDKKIREIEADKKRKLDEVDELLKIKEKDLDVAIDEKKQLALMEEQRQKQLELQKIRSQIEEKTNRAERLSREYEIALRQGKFELKCPYPEIINLFEEAKKIALERGWETEVAIFSSQIYSFKQKLEKDNRLRQIEAEKVKKQEEIEELLKVKEKPVIGLDAEKLESLREQRMIEKEKKDFDRTIDLMINRAESMAREYELSMKKAIKKGKLTENPPFLKIIGIYEQVKRMLLDKERGEEAARYGNQINYYTQKLEQDNKLREIEAKKVQREKEKRRRRF